MAPNVIGTLTTSGNLALGSQNLTVLNDYSNANFGSGNAFNARANVTGTGLIVGSNASQTITGNVIAGAPNQFTIDFGPIRSTGSGTVNYQIANNGTGAEIRGAIQTTNIDPRLSGSGVTAANFGPIVASANSGNLAITVTGGNVGGPITGTIEIVSNFSNVPTQIITLNGVTSVQAIGNATPSPNPLNLGNFHVGTQGAVTSLAVQNTTNVTGAEQLGINSVTGSAGFSGSNVFGSGLIAPGATQAGAVTVAASGTGSAGVNTGTVSIQYASDGTNVDPSFTRQNSNLQTINVTATGYNLAVGSTTPTPVTIANQRIGGSNSQVLTVANSAAAGAFTEVLNASFGANTGSATNNGGSIAGGLGSGGVVGGGSNNTALSVGVNTTAAGAKSGTVTLNYVSNGTGSSGLGNTAATVPTQTINVSGNVYQAAIGQLNAPISLSFGTVQVGQNVAQTLSVSNIATGPNGFVEDLGASFGTTSGVGASLITGTGTIGSLLAGGTDSSSMVVHVNTTAAGSVNGAIAINYTTNGTVNGVSNGLGSAAAGSSSFGVVGTIGANVVDTANPVINNSQPINLGNVRINTTSPTALVSVTNQASGNQQAALNASIAGNAPVTASGSFNLLAPGSTNNTSLQVGMNTNAAGHITGTATVSLVSDASNIGNCAPNCQLGLPSQNVNVTGNVYQIAQPTLPTNVSLGNVHVGGTLSQGLNVTNTLNAPVGFQEGLNATVASTTGAATAVGSITNLAAGGSNNSGIVVGINTATAGAISGTATLGLQSNGSGTSGLATLGLPNSAPITIAGNVYNLAVGSTTPTPVAIANQRIGGSNSQVLTVANSAAAGAFTEVLNASFGANTGSATNNGGSIAGGLGSGGVVGGGSNNTAMSVGVNTTAAGSEERHGDTELCLQRHRQQWSGQHRGDRADADDQCQRQCVSGGDRAIERSDQSELRHGAGGTERSADVEHLQHRHRTQWLRRRSGGELWHDVGGRCEPDHGHREYRFAAGGRH